MSTMVLPSNWEKHRIGTDSITWSRPNHSHGQPNLVIFKAGPAGGGTSKYQVKGVLGVDPASLEAGQAAINTIVELNLRFVEGQVDANVTALLDELADLFSTPAFQADILDLQIPLDGNQV